MLRSSRSRGLKFVLNVGLDACILFHVLFRLESVKIHLLTSYKYCRC